jgi:hypothetical protein
VGRGVRRFRGGPVIGAVRSGTLRARIDVLGFPTDGAEASIATWTWLSVLVYLEVVVLEARSRSVVVGWGLVPLIHVAPSVLVRFPVRIRLVPSVIVLLRVPLSGLDLSGWGGSWDWLRIRCGWG